MGVKRWNGSAYTDLDIPKVNNVVPTAAWAWVSGAYVKLWPPGVAIYDDFNRANSTNIGPLWNKVGANAEIRSNSYAVQTTAGGYGIYTVDSINGDDGYVECTLGGAEPMDSLRRCSILCRVADDGQSGLCLNILSTLSEFGYYTGTLNSSSHTIWSTKLTQNGADGPGWASGQVCRIEFEGDNFIVKKNGTEVLNRSFPYRKGAGYRRGGLVVTQGSFVKSGSFNDFKLADVGA